MLNGVYEDLHEVPDRKDLEFTKVALDASPSIEFLTIEYYRDGNVLYDAYRTIASNFDVCSRRFPQQRDLQW